MASEEFCSFYEGTTLEVAFQRARVQARKAYGKHSGSVAEKKNVLVVTPDVLPYTAARTYAQRRLAHRDTRVCRPEGPAGAIRVKDERHDGWMFFGWAVA